MGSAPMQAMRLRDKVRCLSLDQVALGASENSLWLGYRSTHDDQDRWRCRGGDVGDASFGLALLSVSSARRGTLRVCSAGVLGGSRIARAAGSSPATSKSCLLVCCSGAAGAATLAMAAQTDGCAGAGACGRSAWMSAATRDASAGCAGHDACHTQLEIQMRPSPNNSALTSIIQNWPYYIVYKVGT